MKSDGCCSGVIGIVFGLVLGLLLLYAYNKASKDTKWCDEDMKVGHCEFYSGDKTCYCIDAQLTIMELGEFGNSTTTHARIVGIYENAQSKCEENNGSLAVPNTSDLLIWLSRRMYELGIDTAIVGLRRLDSGWFWMFPTGEKQVAPSEISWRDGFEVNPAHSYAAITVAQAEDERHNYEEKDEGYKWYGFVTSDNRFSDYSNSTGAHFICNYVSAASQLYDTKEGS